MEVTLRTDKDVENYIEKKAEDRRKEIQRYEEDFSGIIMFDISRDLIWNELPPTSKYYNCSIAELIRQKV